MVQKMIHFASNDGSTTGPLNFRYGAAVLYKIEHYTVLPAVALVVTVAVIVIVIVIVVLIFSESLGGSFRRSPCHPSHSSWCLPFNTLKAENRQPPNASSTS